MRAMQYAFLAFFAIVGLALASASSAEAGCKNCSMSGTVEYVSETICLDEATWEAEKHHFRVVKGFKRNYWYAMHTACLAGQVGCLKRGKAYRRCQSLKAAKGTRLCHKSPSDWKGPVLDYRRCQRLMINLGAGGVLTSPKPPFPIFQRMFKIQILSCV